MSDTHSEFDRRQFAARLASCAAAGAAAIAALAPAAAQTQEKPSDVKPDASKPAKPDAEKPAAEKPAAPFNPIAMQLEMLLNLYPSENLTDEGLRMIAGKLAGQWAHSARLSSFPLTNADGPGFVFSAYRAAPEE